MKLVEKRCILPWQIALEARLLCLLLRKYPHYGEEAQKKER